jgi:thiamine-monophosphate kinase
VSARSARVDGGESSIIDAIQSAFGGLVAPGAYDLVDDAAMIPPVIGDRSRVITTDVAVEGVDFDRALYPIVYAGFRALAQNVSDVAAMGASAVGFVWSLAIPSSWSSSDIAEFARGAAILAKLRRVPLFGGDLSRTTGPLVCSITAFGDVVGRPIRRSTAKPGEAVFVLGMRPRSLGASAAGLRMLRARERGEDASLTTAHFDAWLRALPENEAACVRAHLSPLPADGSAIAGAASACIDVSDGLAVDAHRLARASGVRLELDPQQVLDVIAPGAERDDALSGGEDYALLFTAPAHAKVDGAMRIGVVVAGQGVAVGTEELAASGFDHFA